MTPLRLRQLGKQMLGIEWDDNHHSIYNVRNIRMKCRCAKCVDEWSQESKLRDDQVPLDVKPTRIDSVGHYALQFAFTDGHATGIYPYNILRELCECPQCKSR